MRNLTGLLILLAILATSCHEVAAPVIGSDQKIKTFSDGAPMARVHKGEFIMGSAKGESDERPEHAVLLSGFWIDQFEVTNEAYAACVKAGRCQASEKYDGLQESRQPIVGVSWYNAADYCTWVEKRLPSEAEWEKAARGTDARDYPWGNTLDCTRANYRECGLNKTMPVGSYPDGASPYNALDMAGNAAEWVSDFYDPNYYKSSPKENPKGPEKAKYRVIRGGMWLRYAYQMRSSDRAAQAPATRNDTTGFRCAKDG